MRRPIARHTPRLNSGIVESSPEHPVDTPKDNAHRRIAMIKNVFARYLVLLTVGGSLIGGAAVGLAGLAGATTANLPSGPGYSYAPSVTAKPAPEATPGWHHHKGIAHVNALNGN